jgi:protein TonB
MTTAIQSRAATLSASALFCAAVLCAAASLKIEALPVIEPPDRSMNVKVETLAKERTPKTPIVQQKQPTPTVRAPDPIDAAPALAPEVLPAAPVATLKTGPISEPAPAAPVRRRIVGPRWLARPGGRDFAKHYPERALQRGLGADVVLECQVAASGRLSCAVVSESPPSWGFGAAALKISQEFQMAPQLTDGQPTEGGVVRVPIRFTAPKD